MNAEESKMPRYRSHKIIYALEIAKVEGNILYFVEEGFAPIVAPEEMFLRYTPVPGDRYVVYEGDGYKSFSPKKAFEEGYIRIS